MTNLVDPMPAFDEEDIQLVAPSKLPELADVPHPFPYQGSKRILAHTILRYLPSDTSTLIEPFAGSAALSIAARWSRLVTRTIIGDVNDPLMGIWRAIVQDPTELADKYEAMWNASLTDPKSYFLAKRAEFNSTNDPALLLYLLNRIVKGAVRYGKAGLFNQSADNRRLGAKPDTVRERLNRTSEVMSGTEVHSGSFESLLINADLLDVVYMDPPYQGVTNVPDHRYKAGLARSKFEQILFEANDRRISYIISYDVVREDAKYGERLHRDLALTHFHILAGRSAQATLSGGAELTVESIYLSPALVERLQRTAPLVDLFGASGVFR